MAEQDYSNLNTQVQVWTKSTTDKMRERINLFGVKQTGKLYKELKSSIAYHYGVADRISWKMPRYAILADKGVGRGIGMKNGSRYAKTPGALSRRGVKPWFSSVITSELKALADSIARERANAEVKAIKF